MLLLLLHCCWDFRPSELDLITVACLVPHGDKYASVAGCHFFSHRATYLSFRQPVLGLTQTVWYIFNAEMAPAFRTILDTSALTIHTVSHGGVGVHPYVHYHAHSDRSGRMDGCLAGSNPLLASVKICHIRSWLPAWLPTWSRQG